MPETLLQTKLFIPPIRPNLVPRPRLIAHLFLLIILVLMATDCDTLLGPPPAPTNIEEIEDIEKVEFYSDWTKLVGRLLVPEGEGPFPAIVFVQSLGRGTRHEYDAIMDLMQSSGFATFSYDKRGVGDSRDGYIEIVESGV